MIEVHTPASPTTTLVSGDSMVISPHPPAPPSVDPNSVRVYVDGHDVTAAVRPIFDSGSVRFTATSHLSGVFSLSYEYTEPRYRFGDIVRCNVPAGEFLVLAAVEASDRVVAVDRNGSEWSLPFNEIELVP